jgi:hypothetical protein
VPAIKPITGSGKVLYFICLPPFFFIAETQSTRSKKEVYKLCALCVSAVN